MSLLAVSAAGDVLSMALGESAGACVECRLRTRSADERMLPMLRRLLARSGAALKDIRAVAAARGPGRFTGIRIGMTFAEMLALSLGRPAVAVSEFEAWAAAVSPPGARPGTFKCVVLSAGRGDVCLQLFKAGATGAYASAGTPRWAAKAGAQEAIEALCRGRDAVVVRCGGEEKPFDGFTAKFVLAAAAAKLASGKTGEFKPLYLRPANYELARGR